MQSCNHENVLYWNGCFFRGTVFHLTRRAKIHFVKINGGRGVRAEKRLDQKKRQVRNVMLPHCRLVAANDVLNRSVCGPYRKNLFCLYTFTFGYIRLVKIARCLAGR